MSLSEKDRTHDLQACPFCGCHGLSFAWPREFRGRMVAIIECHTDNCYALLTADGPDKAVAAWNRRAEGVAALADEKQEVVASLYKAWPDAEDIPSDWPLGIIGCIEQIISERDEAVAGWKVCRESLTEQAGARRDPTMPVLVPEVIEAWANEAEASYAMAETAEERRNAHGLSLLVEWQRRAKR